MNRFCLVLFSLLFSLLTTGCEENRNIVSAVDEREANVIIVFLDSKGIKATKEIAASGAGAAIGEATAPKFNIIVAPADAINAMAILNSNGLPRRQGTNLLELFAKQGLMQTDKEETIRYQAGLAQQLANMILMIDGVIDANVQLSFPQESTGAPEATPQRVTASVFVKHQGIIDDPNSHLETKIKRLVAGSVNGLDINDVTVISDRSRFTDFTTASLMNTKGGPTDFVRIWSMVVSKESAGILRLLFFFILALAIVFAAGAAWLMWKMYPLLKTRGGIKELWHAKPLMSKEEETPPNETI